MKSDAVAFGKDGSFYVTDGSNYLHHFDEEGNSKNKITVQRKDDYSRRTLLLQGLAVCFSGELYIGAREDDDKYVRILRTHSIIVSNVCPEFIAVTPEKHVIISGASVGRYESPRRKRNVFMHCKESTNSYKIKELPMPTDVLDFNFSPTGVCVHKGHKVIFIACATDVPAIYCYSYSGEYLGVVTRDVTAPQGIALSEGEDKLAVCDGDTVKIFCIC